MEQPFNPTDLDAEAAGGLTDLLHKIADHKGCGTTGGSGKSSCGSSAGPADMAPEIWEKVKNHPCYSEDPLRLRAVARLVAEAANRPIARAKAIVGADIFTHESGIHVAALMKDVRTYQGIDPATLGRRNKIVIGKHSGLSAITGLCAELDVDINREQAAEVLVLAKRRARLRNRPLGRGDVARLIEEVRRGLRQSIGSGPTAGAPA